MKVILQILICFFILILIDGSHYRGGFITWKPQYPHITNQNPVPIILKQRHVWRRKTVSCNDTTIANKTKIGDPGNVMCISAKCYNISALASVAAPCVAYSIQNDWSTGEISTVVNISANITFEAAFQGTAWISTLGVGANGRWSISTGITTIPRSDGTYNTAPSSSMSSIKLLQVGSTYTWEIPVADTDGDIVRCRWAKNGSFDECAAVCDGFPGSILNNDPCTMTYNATKTGSWVVALKIEDFEFSSQPIALSGASIQFIVIVYSNTSNCTTRPFYYGKQPPDACISVNVGLTINEIAEFSIGCDNTTITEVEMYKPDNMVVSVLEVNPLNASLYIMNVTWTPTSIDLGVNLVCYTPLDNINRQGNQVCIKYFVHDNDSKFSRSKYINGSMKPVGQVYSNQSIWHIQYSNEVRRPSFDAYIRFYSKSTNEQVYQINVRTSLNDVIYSNNNLTFITSITWNISEQYYILFDSSIVTDPSVCGPQSPAIIDTNYWTFEVVDTMTTMPVNHNCFQPEIILIPSASSLLSPLQFRRNENFYITSHIILNCNDSLSIITKWTMENCTSTCSNLIEIDPKIMTNYSELFIPARTLPYGIYKFKLIVIMNISSSLISSNFTYIKITRSNIRVNLIQFGTSVIKYNRQHDLILDPGTYSIDPDQHIFNSNDWIYEYYCRIYGTSTFQTLNSSCFTSNKTLGISDSSKSFLIINANLFSINQSYQFLVYIKNRQNSSIQAPGYLLVDVKDIGQHIIAISCIVSKLCNPDSEYQTLNPTTQLSLYSICTGNCPTISNITWNIYQGLNLSSNIMQWALFNQINFYENIWFFGRNTKNFTAINQLFKSYPQIKYWKFEVIYSFISDISSSALNFIINGPPENGSCSINPRIGTTNTLFNISCTNWLDEYNIKDYSVYVWTIDPLKRLMIAFSFVSDFQVRLPAGDNNTFVLNMIIHIRDEFDCIQEWNISSLIVQPDTKQISTLIENLQGSINETNSNSMIRLLASGNQNIVAQIMTLLLQEFNQENLRNLYNVISKGISATSVFVSSLESSRLQREYLSSNKSVLNEYNQILNIYAKIQDFLILYMINFAILGSNSIQLQASALVQLTQSTNQLTQTLSILVSERCYYLSQVLYSLANEILYEDVQSTAILLAQCISNVMTAIDGPLQKRTSVLDLDYSHVNNTDMEFFHYQKQISDKINKQGRETISFLTSALNVHLNIAQNMTINTSSVFMILKKTSLKSISNRSIEQIENSQIYIPLNITSNITNDTIISFRSIIQPLVPIDNTSQLNLKLSRLVSFSILDENNQELFIQTNFNHPIELIIPRDRNVFIPSMILEDVISINNASYNQIFYLKYINITSNLAISIHFEIHPLNKNLAYLFIYKFDNFISISQIDGWTVFCPSNLTKDNLYIYFIDNQQTIDHRILIYGLRELNSIEIEYICSNQSIKNLPIINEKFYFTSNYEIRIYTSGCYYLDSNNNWQSDGLLVGPLTNHYETQCFSTHLTTFTSAFRFLPTPINLEICPTKVATNRIYLQYKTDQLTEEVDDLKMNNSIQSTHTVNNLEIISFVEKLELLNKFCIEHDYFNQSLSKYRVI